MTFRIGGGRLISQFMKTRVRVSEKEFEMIKSISPHWAKIIDEGDDNYITPVPRILEIIALECFTENKIGKDIDSLRRCVNACRKCNPYRMTEEYDKLIEL